MLQHHHVDLGPLPVTESDDGKDALDILLDAVFQTDTPEEDRIEEQKDELDRLLESITEQTRGRRGET